MEVQNPFDRNYDKNRTLCDGPSEGISDAKWDLSPRLQSIKTCSRKCISSALSYCWRWRYWGVVRNKKEEQGYFRLRPSSPRTGRSRIRSKRQIKLMNPPALTPGSSTVPTVVTAVAERIVTVLASPLKEETPQYMNLADAVEHLRLTAPQLRDLCAGKRITYSIQLPDFRSRKTDLDEWFDVYKICRKSPCD
jgi:hypothetical protein